MHVYCGVHLHASWIKQLSLDVEISNIADVRRLVYMLDVMFVQVLIFIYCAKSKHPS